LAAESSDLSEVGWYNIFKVIFIHLFVFNSV